MTDEAMDSYTAFFKSFMDECLELRFAEHKVGPHSAPAQVMEELWEVRARIDRVEELLLQVYRLKEKFKRELAVARAVKDDKFDETLDAISKNPKSRLGEYSSARERAAEINLKILSQIRDERTRDEIHSRANEAYTVIKQLHSGLENYKQDLNSIIRLYQIESSLGGRR